MLNNQKQGLQKRLRSFSEGDRTGKMELSVGKGGGSKDWVTELKECKTQLEKANSSSENHFALSMVKTGKL